VAVSTRESFRDRTERVALEQVLRRGDVGARIVRLEPPRVVRRPRHPRRRSPQDERGSAFGVAGSEQRRHRAAVAGAEEDNPFRAERVEDGGEVVHALLQRPDPGSSIGKAHAALVEQDQPRRLGEALVEGDEFGHLPRVLEVGDDPRHDHEVERSRADGLVGDEEVAGSRVLDVRAVHA